MSRAIQTGDRVSLRRPAPRDRDRFLELVRASRTLLRPWSYPPRTPEAFEDYLRRGRKRTQEHFLVRRHDNDDIAGVINLSEIVRGAFQNAFVGYYGFRPSAGRGLVTEGMGLVLRHAFTRLGLHRIEANIQPGNAASIALAKRAGFRFEGFSPRYLKVGGRWRDHEHWVMLAEGWRARGG